MDIILTPEGAEILKAKVEKLQKELKELTKGRSEAYEFGDGWHDNPAWEALEEKERMLLHEIRESQETLRRATISEAKGTKESAGIGSIVTVRFANGETKNFTLADSQTADPATGSVSIESPIGKVLFGARVGEEKSYIAGEEAKKVEILAIE